VCGSKHRGQPNVGISVILNSREKKGRREETNLRQQKTDLWKKKEILPIDRDETTVTKDIDKRAGDSRFNREGNKIKGLCSKDPKSVAAKKMNQLHNTHG